MSVCLHGKRPSRLLSRHRKQDWVIRPALRNADYRGLMGTRGDRSGGASGDRSASNAKFGSVTEGGRACNRCITGPPVLLLNISLTSLRCPTTTTTSLTTLCPSTPTLDTRRLAPENSGITDAAMLSLTHFRGDTIMILCRSPYRAEQPNLSLARPAAGCFSAAISVVNIMTSRNKMKKKKKQPSLQRLCNKGGHSLEWKGNGKENIFPPRDGLPAGHAACCKFEVAKETKRSRKKTGNGDEAEVRKMACGELRASVKDGTRAP
ncbi:hypothetical protein E2C01_058657 [Portunus trituberculatus]|uniref:Uncharacterized protein n=1 Tax=Portunus trituberculatus TaxID=210409 RepID=A0A5B7H3M2_PORTR|nr:hypothetical protein [Portunus trituberculatus]